MPSHYTHYYFGKQIIKSMPDNIKEIINTNSDSIDAFMLGLHGPDILFFYKPYLYNSINREGYQIHNHSAFNFFSRSVPYVRENPKPEEYSYLLGFMCHYMADSSCHPIIAEYMERTGLSHAKLEMELDSYILRKNGLNPLREDTLKHLNHNPNMGRVAAPFFHSASNKKVLQSIDSMCRILYLFSSENDCTRAGETLLMSAFPPFKGHGGMIVTDTPNPLSAEASERLFEVLTVIVNPTITQLENLLATIDNDNPLDERLKINFNGKFVN